MKKISLFIGFIAIFFYNLGVAQTNHSSGLILIDGSGWLRWEDFMEIGKTIATFSAPTVNHDSIMQVDLKMKGGDCVDIGFKAILKDVSLTICKDVSKLEANANNPGTAILYISLIDGPLDNIQDKLIWAKNIGVKKLIIFFDRLDLVDGELLEYCERAALKAVISAGYSTDNTFFIRGSFGKSKPPYSWDNPYLKGMVQLMVVLGKT